MASSKKRKRKPTKTKAILKQEAACAQRVYLSELYKLCELVGCEQAIKQLTQLEKRIIYLFRLHIKEPRVRKGGKISTSFIKYFREIFRYAYDNYTLPLGDTGHELSLRQWMYIEELHQYVYHGEEDRKLELQEAFKLLLDHLESEVKIINTYIDECAFIVLLNSRIVEPMYVLHSKMEVLKNSVSGRYLVQELEHIEPRKTYVRLNGRKRPVYQVGYPVINKGMDWIYVPSSWLVRYYKGTRNHLPVCVQTHALRRLYQRIDCYDWGHANVFMYKSFKEREDFRWVGRRLFFTLRCDGLKTGYFVGDLVDDCIVIRTFLFLTNKGTPEARKLKELTGLDKEDMVYWKIGRLSAFMGADISHSPDEKKMFEQAGMGDLFCFEAADEKARDKVRKNNKEFKELIQFIREGSREDCDDWYKDEWEKSDEEENYHEETESL